MLCLTQGRHRLLSLPAVQACAHKLCLHLAALSRAGPQDTAKHPEMAAQRLVSEVFIQGGGTGPDCTTSQPVHFPARVPLKG